MWLVALLAGLYAKFLLRGKPQRQLQMYVMKLPLVMLIVTVAVLAGCGNQTHGTPKGAATLSITATSGTFSQNTMVTLTVQ
jgi:hypothetical protein